jgi:acetoin utilization deacetylase AcuC-like enzyme
MHRRDFLTWASLAGLQLVLPSSAGFANPGSETSQTGLLLDPFFLKHSMGPGHPETPERLKRVESRLQSAEVFEALQVFNTSGSAENLVSLIHTQRHIDSIKARHPVSHEVVCRIIDGASLAADMVMRGDIKNAFCAVRPPGHHAENTGHIEGFCVYNSIAVLARYLQKDHGLKRILIIDWDYHHGNGTESAFYTDPSILFFSSHDQFAYPGTGSPHRTGSGEGEGYNINVHLPCGATDDDIVNAFSSKLLPAAEAFKPEFILISAGFDSRKQDSLGCFDITDDGFRELTRMTMALADKHCQGRIISMLEGGYNLQGNAEATLAHVETLASQL